MGFYNLEFAHFVKRDVYKIFFSETVLFRKIKIQIKNVTFENE